MTDPRGVVICGMGVRHGPQPRVSYGKGGMLDMQLSRRHWWIVAVLLASACHRDAHAQAGNNGEFGTITPEQLAARMANHETIAVFDNNSHDSYVSGHVPGARWVAFNNIRASDLPADRTTPLVFYCHNER
jgi:Rhodanese-like domain